MKYWKFIQAGNEQQCEENSIREWEYTFGIRTTGSVYGTSYTCYNDDKGKHNWSIDDEYAMSFQLLLTF